MVKKEILLISDDPSYKDIKKMLKDDSTQIFTANSLEKGFNYFYSIIFSL